MPVADCFLLIARQECGSGLLPVGALSVEVRHDQLERQLKAGVIAVCELACSAPSSESARLVRLSKRPHPLVTGYPVWGRRMPSCARTAGCTLVSKPDNAEMVHMVSGVRVSQPPDPS